MAGADTSFGGRFAAAAITSDRHLLAAHRYVLRNPATAGLCAGPADWRWSSFRAVLGLDPAFQFLDIVGLLELFDPRPAVAVMAFRRLVEDSSLKPAVSYKLARSRRGLTPR